MPYFFARAPARHILTFNSRSLYKLKHKVRVSERVCEIFHFLISIRCYSSLYFFQQKVWTLRLNVITPFKIKMTEKPRMLLLSDL